jgi:hypothetical protein
MRKRKNANVNVLMEEKIKLVKKTLIAVVVV